MARSSRERVAQNFIRRYGMDALKNLLDSLARGDSGQEIANRFEVSRERVRQWKNTFGQVVTLYQVHPEVAHLLVTDEVPAPASKPSSGSSSGVYLVED